MIKVVFKLGLTYQPPGDIVHAWNEDSIRNAIHGKRTNAIVVFDGTDEVFIAHH